MRTALLSLLVIFTAAAQDQPGSIQGTVLDAASHQPVRKASVLLNVVGNFVTNGHTLNPPPPQTSVTGFDGQFTFGNLAAGQYQVTVMHQNYPQARMGGVRKMVQVTGDAASVTIELIPGASVTGHIVDEDGDPLTGCNVQIHPARNVNQGVPMTGMPSNDEGVYRLYDIPPGKYVFSAQCSAVVFEPRPLSAGPNPPPKAAYPIQYYPAASDFQSAEVLELSPGAEKSGIDFRMQPVPVVSVHGTIAPGADWHGRDNLQVSLVPLDHRGPMGLGPGSFGRVNEKTGTFELRQVFPGSYRLLVFSQVGGSPGAPPDLTNRIGGSMRVDVSDKPIEISLPLHPAMEVSGTLEIERGTDTNRQVTPSQIGIQLTSAEGVGAPPKPAQVKDDGTFIIESVLPGEWRIHANGPFIFVKSAWLGSDEVTNRPLDLTSGAAPPLRIVVSTNTATIRGTGPAGESVLAERIDDDDPQHMRMGAGVDPNGQFTMQNLAPGRYRLALQNGGPFPATDTGQEVTVGEGETASVDLK
jgi:uncharacterized protein (DUF2141 family)